MRDSGRASRRLSLFKVNQAEYFHADNPQAIKPVEIMNAKRFFLSA